jgi:hypothetical protein
MCRQGVILHCLYKAKQFMLVLMSLCLLFIFFARSVSSLAYVGCTAVGQHVCMPLFVLDDPGARASTASEGAGAGCR